MNPLLQHLQRLATARREEFLQAVATLPSLLATSTHERLAMRFAEAPPADRPSLETALKRLVDYRATALNDPQKCPLGAGPIEQIWEEHEAGMISFPEALKRARADDLPPQISAPYIIAISSWTLSNQKVKLPVRLARLRLVHAAIEGLPRPFDGHDLLGEVTLDLVEVTSFLLVSRADGRLYREAVARGEEIVREARNRDDPLAAAMLFRLGALHLDPFFTARKPSPEYETDVQNWQYQFGDEYAAELAGVPREQWTLPAPLVAAQRAETYLQEAIERGRGDTQVRALKALVLAYGYRRDRLRQPVDTGLIRTTCDRALAATNRQAYPHQWLSLVEALAGLDLAIPVAEVKELLHAPVEELRRAQAAPLLIDLIKMSVRLLRRASPADAAATLRRFHAFVTAHGSDRDRAECFDHELALAIRAAPATPPPGDTRAAAEELRQRSAREGWSPGQRAAALLAVARQSSARDEEADGLALLDEIATVAPDFFASHRDALRHDRAILAQNLGAGAHRAHDWPAAVPAYVRALQDFIALGMQSSARNTLELVEDLSTSGTTETTVTLVREIAPLTLLLYRSLGDTSIRLLQRLCDRALLSLTGTPGQEETVNFLLQIAKGHRFAAALDRKHPLALDEDAAAREILQRLESLPAAAPAVPLDEETLLTAYVSRDPLLGGGSPAEVRINLQQAFDTHLSGRLLEHREGEQLHYLSCHDIQAHLDARTALISIYVGAPLKGGAPVHSIVFTREKVQVAALFHEFFPEDAAQSVGRTHPAAALVAALRTALAEDPSGTDPLTPKADGLLRKSFPLALGGATNLLLELNRAGKTRLCVVPHGPLHFFPYHLLGGKKAPLADAFMVSYLPNLHLLNTSADTTRTVRMASLGVADDLPAAVAEARDVAALFGTQAEVGEAATRAAASAALQRARHVHLSAHGRHHVVAPAFQMIQLAPTEEDDGQLLAYEIAAMDLNGLELLTLSACETALGRFDVGDNLRGMPAAFFVAGTKAIVGTLWSAEVNASRLFFVSLHRALATGAPLADAFSAAQRVTRKNFPQFRDWGPFYLMGR